MSLENPHETPRDCMGLGRAPGSYSDFTYLDFIWILFFLIVKDNKKNEN